MLNLKYEPIAKTGQSHQHSLYIYRKQKQQQKTKTEQKKGTHRTNKTMQVAEEKIKNKPQNH